jgi:hypothetical protein
MTDTSNAVDRFVDLLRCPASSEALRREADALVSPGGNPRHRAGVRPSRRCDAGIARLRASACK